MKWIESNKRLPNGSSLNQVQVIAFKEDWICPDSNPLGQRMCWYDGEVWNCARLSAYKEVYLNLETGGNDAPTHWQPLNEAPKQLY